MDMSGYNSAFGGGSGISNPFTSAISTPSLDVPSVAGSFDNFTTPAALGGGFVDFGGPLPDLTLPDYSFKAPDISKYSYSFNDVDKAPQFDLGGHALSYTTTNEPSSTGNTANLGKELGTLSGIALAMELAGGFNPYALVASQLPRALGWAGSKISGYFANKPEGTLTAPGGTVSKTALDTAKNLVGSAIENIDYNGVMAGGNGPTQGVINTQDITQTQNMGVVPTITVMLDKENPSETFSQSDVVDLVRYAQDSMTPEYFATTKSSPSQPQTFGNVIPNENHGISKNYLIPVILVIIIYIGLKRL